MFRSVARSSIRLARRGAPFPLVRLVSRPSVLMWHHGRCGSTVLGDLLNQHPAIRWHGEIFVDCEGRADAPERFDPIMRGLVRGSVPRIAGYEVKGLACQHPGLMRRPLPEMVAAMRGYGLGQAVHLERRNVLLKLVSVAIVREKLVAGWHIGTAERGMQDRRIRLDPEAVTIFGRTAPLVAMIDYIERGCRESRELLSREMPTLGLVYEDDIEADPTAAYRKVVTFLGLAAEPVTLGMKKINVRPLPDLLENYDEVRRVLAGTPHAWMADAG
jgi:hypothetical protein